MHYRFITPVLFILFITSCGGSDTPPIQDIPPVDNVSPPEPETLDDITAESNELWHSANRGVRISISYDNAPNELFSFTNNALKLRDYGLLEPSSFILDTDELVWFGDDYGDTILEIELSSLPLTVELDSATEILNADCNIIITQSLELSGILSQGELRLILNEQAQLSPTNQGGCSESLQERFTVLSNQSVADFPYDIISLLNLRTIDTQRLDNLSGWSLNHEHLIIKYYKTIGDTEFELADILQRISYSVFSPASTRASLFATQLGG